MKLYYLPFSITFLCFTLNLAQLQSNSYNRETKKAVTYDLGGGRFGDKLVGYVHAKWISYKYNIPFLYRPFIFSDRLVLHYEDEYYTNENGFNKIIRPDCGEFIDYTLCTGQKIQNRLSLGA